MPSQLSSANLLILAVCCLLNSVISDSCVTAKGDITKNTCLYKNNKLKFQLNRNISCDRTQMFAPRSLELGVFSTNDTCGQYQWKTPNAQVAKRCCGRPPNTTDCKRYSLPLVEYPNKLTLKDLSLIKNKISQNCIGISERMDGCQFAFKPSNVNLAFYLANHLGNEPHYISFVGDCIHKSTIYDIVKQSPSSTVTGKSVSFYYNSSIHQGTITRHCRVYSTSCYENVTVTVISDGANCHLDVKDPPRKMACGSIDKYADLTIGTGRYFYDITINVSVDDNTPILWIEAKSSYRSMLSATCQESAWVDHQPCSSKTDISNKSATSTTTKSTLIHLNEPVKAGPIAGGVVGGLVAVGIVGGVLAFLYRKNKVGAETTNTAQQDVTEDIFTMNTDRISPSTVPASTKLH